MDNVDTYSLGRATHMSKYPIGFMSYVRLDDEHDHGRLSKFRNRLSGEVRMHTGELFHIFQDRSDIEWGHNWHRRIVDCLDHGTFLIPILTPSFFKSDACRDELERFLARESDLGRHDLILPIYYVNCPILNDASRRKDDPLVTIISERNYFDWRELRYESLSSSQSAKMMAKLAGQIAAALETRIPEQLRTDQAGATQVRGKAEPSGPTRTTAAGPDAAGGPPAQAPWMATQARLWPDTAPCSPSSRARATPPLASSDAAGHGGKSMFEI